MAALWQRRHRPSVPSICWAKSKTLGEAPPGRAPGRQLQCCRSVCSIPLPCADAWTQTSGTGLAWEHGDSKVIGHGRASSSCLCTAAGLCYVGQRVPGVGLAGTCANGVRVAQAQRLGALHGACVCVHTAGVGAAPVSPHGLWVCIATPCSAHVCVCMCVLQRCAGGSVCVCVWLC